MRVMRSESRRKLAGHKRKICLNTYFRTNLLSNKYIFFFLMLGLWLLCHCVYNNFLLRPSGSGKLWKIHKMSFAGMSIYLNVKQELFSKNLLGWRLLFRPYQWKVRVYLLQTISLFTFSLYTPISYGKNENVPCEKK